MPKTGGAVAKSKAAGQDASRGTKERKAADPLVKTAAHFDTGPDMTIDQFKAAKFYQAGSTDINGPLRGVFPGMDAHMAHVPHLDALVKLTTTNKPLTLYRGVEEFAGFKPSQLRAGHIVSDKAFFSTSFKKSTAEGFAPNIGSEGIVFSIAVPKGTHALPMFRLGTGSSFQASEHEVLFPRGTSIRIKSVRKDKSGVYRAKAELIQ